ncbi:MAG: glycogen debranching protein [Leptolyngbyaceae cyanobacterium SL_1_1]|nr:glycogen debranching protein [Leptolyngbyaceae cyanobacterium RM1_1_2]NJO10216.1 glycogen debranching protein [Leptolyngbyaceae cyanobacterium SL_1_1]
MGIEFGRETCGSLPVAESREWLVTNGIGGYASGTVAGLLTRCYHGLLLAALKPPLGRTLLLTKLEEGVAYGGQTWALSANRWADGTVNPLGYQQIERFSLAGTTPVWQFVFSDAQLEKRIWMQPGVNTTYVQYRLHRATAPLQLTLSALVNYRDHHGNTQGSGWQMGVEAIARGIQIVAYPGATPFYLFSDRAEATLSHTWYTSFDLAVERTRGLRDREDHLQAATFTATLHPGESLTLAASTEKQLDLLGESAFQLRSAHEQRLLKRFASSRPPDAALPPDWINQLALAADQFIVSRTAQPADPAPAEPAEPGEDGGKTVIAGYHWFGDWGRDTMISLPGLTLATGRPEVARSILRTFAKYVDQGMLPNVFPEAGEIPEYNTVDANLWYFEAIRQYYSATEDKELLGELFPVLAEMIDWHCRGTRYQIHLDPADGLLYAGEAGVQLTWMDAKIGDLVITPRTGKPVEVNALWYNALRTLAKFARQLGKPHQDYEAIADRTLASFSRFWHEAAGYCYDVLDTPTGDDAALRPNQIFAVSLPESPLTPAQQQKVVEACGRLLLTSHGLRSLSPQDPHYIGHYGGTRFERDSAYHQGTVWGWLIGAFTLAHLRVYGNAALAHQFLEPMSYHLSAHGLGSLSEIFDGDAPMMPHGCVAQAWTVAEVLRAWRVIEDL